MVQDAVARNLQTLAEASGRLSEAAKERVAEVPWRAITGFRNVLVHGYLGIDADVVWRVIERDLPPLKSALLKLQATLEKKET